MSPRASTSLVTGRIGTVLKQKGGIFSNGESVTWFCYTICRFITSYKKATENGSKKICWNLNKTSQKTFVPRCECEQISRSVESAFDSRFAGSQTWMGALSQYLAPNQPKMYLIYMFIFHVYIITYFTVGVVGVHPTQNVNFYF